MRALTKPVRYVIGVDPSGNYNEGNGITGIAVYDRVEDKIVALTEVQNKDYTCREQAWLMTYNAIATLYNTFEDEYHEVVVIVEDYRLYAGTRGSSQTYSELETPRLIGELQSRMWSEDVPYHLEMAAEVKSRWNDNLLVAKKYITAVGKSFAWNGNLLMTHHRDAIRHAIHGGRIKLNGYAMDIDIEEDDDDEEE